MIVKLWQLLLVVGAVVAGGGLLVGGLAGRLVALTVIVTAVALWILDKPAGGEAGARSQAAAEPVPANDKTRVVP